MAAVLATALTFGSISAVRPDAARPKTGRVGSLSIVIGDAAAAPRRPRLACRWIRDADSGRMVCAWEADPEGRRPNLHLTLVRA